ncbi:OmpA family protein [Desulforhopalus sp. IMCC35007]|uniref:OmpA family protein n=1 Tax=Desulforhopalus sp. IMCC35007 TaxID=2569543 RepID=UPI0010AEDAC6|nr:OmpA family protein [Desulforhopalus sp. IMCC35007]TKB12268.1 OmpA family protein [Desulforhopalus sp. IMCC35007]
MMIQARKQIPKNILIAGVFFLFISSICSPVSGPNYVPISSLFCRSAWGLDIRQDFFSYSPAINTSVQIPTHQTFIIAGRRSFNPEYPEPKSRPFPVVYFDLGSARLSRDAGNKLLMDLRKCCAASPLHLTGYTCSIGSEKQNLQLSRNRAEAVAAMLRRNGFKVASVKGEGEGKGLIDGNTPESNRRVEIKPTKN